MARILIVDDEEMVRSLLREALEADKHDILEAKTGKEAGDIYRDSPVDLIITDLVMPGKNGIELILDLKAEHPEVRIVAVSGGGGITGRFDYLPIAKLIGAKAILSKPFEMRELRAMVTEVLG